MVPGGYTEGVRRATGQVSIDRNVGIAWGRHDLKFLPGSGSGTHAAEVHRLVAVDEGADIGSGSDAGVLAGGGNHQGLAVANRALSRCAYRNHFSIDKSDGTQVDVNPSSRTAAHSRVQPRDRGVSHAALGDQHYACDPHLVSDLEFQAFAHTCTVRCSAAPQ